MRNAERILDLLDQLLEQPVELTLYGRAALSLGFPNSPDEYAWSQDVDGVLWLGQAEELAAKTNFWSAVDRVNEQLQDSGLFMSHLFEEDQVILRPNWREARSPIGGVWKNLVLYRLSDIDLILSKMMRNDPVDRQDIVFILKRTHASRADVQGAIMDARVPAIPEIVEQFDRAKAYVMSLFDAGL